MGAGQWGEHGKDRCLKQRIDKRCKHGGLCEHKEKAEGDEHEEDRSEPPLFADTEELPELMEDGEFRRGHW